MFETYEFKGGTFNDVKSWAVYGTGNSNAKGIISHEQNWAPNNSDYTIRNIVRGYIPQANHDLFLAAGAAFNPNTGYYELNGLTDISYEDMCVIYNDTNHLRYDYDLYASGWLSKARTNLPLAVSTHYSKKYILDNIFFAAHIEVFSHTARLRIESCTSMFYNCSRLRHIIQEINLSDFTKVLEGQAGIFKGCRALKSVKLKGLSVNLFLNDCSSLDVESIGYMVTNTLAKSPISITLHPDAYARAMADPAVQAALTAKPNVSLASA